MATATEPLLGNSNVNAISWYANLQGPGIGFPGFELPTDDDDKTALIYQFLLEISTGRVSFFTAGMHLFNARGGDTAVRELNRQMVEKFVRHVQDRLDDLIEDTDEKASVPIENLRIVLYHADGDINMADKNVTNIHGAQGSNIATSNSQISNSSASYSVSSNADLSTQLEGLRSFLGQVSEDRRQETQTAVDILIAASKQQQIDNRSAVVGAAETIRNVGGQISQTLENILLGTAGSLAGSVIVAAMRMGFGLPV